MDWGLLILYAAIIVLFGWGVWRGHQRQEKLLAAGIRVPGLIIENKICWGRIIVVRPVVQFQTVEGEKLELVDRNGTAMAIPRFAKGKEVMVVYNSDNPADFTIITRGNFS